MRAKKIILVETFGKYYILRDCTRCSVSFDFTKTDFECLSFTFRFVALFL